MSDTKVLRRVILRLLAVFGIISFSGGSAFAQITLDRSIIYFKAGERPFKNVVVRNGSDDVMYVTVEPTEVTDPGTGEEKRVDTKDFVVSPRRFSIEAQGSRTVRLLVTRKQSDIESVFRARFIPQSRAPGREIEKQVGDTSTRIKVLTGAGVLVFSEPLGRTEKLEWQRAGTDVVFQNKGNTNAMLFEIEVCTSVTEGSCTPIEARRLYAGNTWTVKVESSKYLKLKKETGIGTEDIIIEPVS